jgi:hypothetical protein
MADVGGFVTMVQQRYGMRPVVPLEFPIEIGDIGSIAGDGTWKPISTVRHFFHSFPGRVRRVTDSRVWEATSGADVSFQIYGNGETSELVTKLANAKARAEIEFGSSGSFVFAASGVTIRKAEETEQLIDKIRLAYHLRRQRPEDGRWYKEFMFVFEVADAQRFTAMLAERETARVAIMARGPFGPPSAPERLASVVKFGVGSEDLQRTNQRDALGRFYRAYQLRPEILKHWREEPWTRSRDVITFDNPPSSFEETFAEV